MPFVYCPKEDKQVPVWWCLGSYTQGRETCPEITEATVKFVEGYAVVKCKERFRKKSGVNKMKEVK